VRLRLRRLRLCLRRRWAMNLRLPWQRPSLLPAAGIYAYTKELAGGRAQLHLRVEGDGSGLLLINANRAVHLNATATKMAWMLLEGRSKAHISRDLQSRFRVSRAQIDCDLRAVANAIDGLVDPNGLCPVHDLDLEILPPFSEAPSAPYRMDLALTYRCNANCAHCYNARPRSFPELPTESWERIIDRTWEIGIPHICFTGGEATLRPDLTQLIHHAQSNGQITGLLTNGRLLADSDLVQSLVDAGLDHVQITLESHLSDVHDGMVCAEGAWEETVAGIRNCLEAELYVMTNTTLLSANAPEVLDTIDFLADLGVPTVGCNALIYAGKGQSVGTGLRESQLEPLLEQVRERTDRYGQRLIWYTPTQYCHFDPVQMQLGVKSCSAARYNMCVEPDGGVIPCQSFYHQLGNILTDSWESIWNHDLALWIRERRYVPETCHGCALLKECGGGCPLTILHEQGHTADAVLEVMHGA
jgi:radical SAM protein with 4Fe4S-binding SPASM domain